ncbi:Uncharacterized protein YjbI, contains pentapeptide repeats [Rhizobiales bacterium GAS113]|nr:Uncharacterized protein YjbI, contains pentapeptide repeats [Rhizobiales bacterium GAS113]
MDEVVDCTLSGQPPYDCEGCDLSGRDFAGKDLTNAVLKAATLTGASFRGAVSLRGADLTGAMIGEGTDFSGCDLSATILDIGASIDAFLAKPPYQAPTKPISFVGATVPFGALGMTWRFLDLTDATIVGLPQDLSRLDVTQCNLTRFDFSGRTLKNAHFASAVLRGTNFSKGVLDHIVFRQSTDDLTDLTGASFSRAQIPGATFDDSTLTGADFSDATTLVGTRFLNAGMEGTIFDRTDLTTCAFSTPPYWSRDPDHLTSFRGATLNYATLQTDWSFLDLTDTVLMGLDKSVDLSGLLAQYAVLTRRNFDGYTLTSCDLSGATLDATSFADAKMQQAILDGTRGDGAVFDCAILTPDASFGYLQVRGDPRRAVLHGASFKNAKLNGAYLAGADFGPAPTPQKDGTTLDLVSHFDGAQMLKVTATNGDFTSATFTGGVLLNGATFAYATLTKADLTGAHLESLSEVFRVNNADDDYTSLLEGLRQRELDKVARVFGKHGISAPTEIDGVDPSWKVKCSESYTVLLHVWSDQKSSSLLVLPETGASLTSLSYAFMPGAVLTDANLYGVDASHAELWPNGTARQLAGAIMDEITLASAILGTDLENIDLSNASLVDAVLTDAFLVNANFTGATLNGARFDNAQLQGADFTKAVMTGVQLTNAAVAIAATALTDGVWLFDVRQGERDAFAAELEAAVANQFELTDDPDTYAQYLTDLGRSDLTRVRQGFAGEGGVQLGPKATVTSKRDGLLWKVDDPDGAQGTYFVWAIPLEKALEAGPSLPLLTSVFANEFQITLSPQATVSHEADDQDPPNWILDNGSGNPDDVATGYVQFLVKQDADSGLSVYGIEMHAAQGLNQQAMVVIEVKATTLRGDAPYLAPDTRCPNGAAYSDNKDHVPWDDALRARTPPQPPPCVPSRVASCNAPPPS